MSKVWARFINTDNDQPQESDSHFLTRLGQQYGATATIKAGHLLFIATGTGTTASGKTLPTVYIQRSDGDLHSFSQGDYTGVQARWNQRKYAHTQTVIAGTPGKLKTLRHTHRTRADAQAAADAEWHALQLSGTTLQLQLAQGNATLLPDTPVKVSGYKQEIDTPGWIISRVVHEVGSQGFVTRVELEVAI